MSHRTVTGRLSFRSNMQSPETLEGYAMQFDLDGTAVCITGGASGIGRACALQLAGQGARLAIIDRQQDRVDAAVAELTALGAKAAGVALDVRDREAVEAAAEALEAAVGPIDHLIGCAGTSRVGFAEEISEKDFDLVMDINVKGLFFCAQSFGRRMMTRSKGSMVLVGSLDGLGGHTGRSQYVASKFAVCGLTKNLALEWGRFGIRVNSVAPSFVDTPMVRQMTPAAYLEDVVIARTPLARLVTPEEVASAILMLLSPASAFITGVVLPVDGGLTTGYVTNACGSDMGWAPLQ